MYLMVNPDAASTALAFGMKAESGIPYMNKKSPSVGSLIVNTMARLLCLGMAAMLPGWCWVHMDQHPGAT